MSDASAAGGSPGRPPGLRGELAQAMGDQFSLERSIGGVRGVLESVLPLTVFSLWYGISHALVPSCVAAAVPAVVLGVWRLVRRESLMQAVSGVAGVALGAVLAVKTGQARNFILPSIIKNIGYGAAYAVSALVRWPLIGVILGLALGEGTHWRQVPARRRAYVIATWVWAGLFGVRLLVEVPLYLAGNASALAIATVPLGLPLFALTIWLTYLVVRRVPLARPDHGLDHGLDLGLDHRTDHPAAPREGAEDDVPVRPDRRG